MATMAEKTTDAVKWLLQAVTFVLLGFIVFYGKGVVNDVKDNGKEINKVESRVTAIEANRFTAENGLEIWREIASIRETMPKEVPPQWFLDRFNRFEVSVTQRLGSIEDELKDRRDP